MNTIPLSLARQFYAIMVKTIGVTDPAESPWKEWSFCYTLNKLKSSWYVLDSSLGFGAKFVLEDGGLPHIIVSEPLESKQANEKLRNANHELANLYRIYQSVSAGNETTHH